ncbi:MAG: nuclear transport factor 2 family protein [Actinomycetota bacterium]
MTLDRAAFVAMMDDVADAWMRGDTDRALARFSDDARYVEPPDVQRYVGRDELRVYFGGDDPPPMSLAWHHLVFDEVEQVGAAEYTYRGQGSTSNGVALIRIEDDLIADWREYQARSELDWETFSAGNRF